MVKCINVLYISRLVKCILHKECFEILLFFRLMLDKFNLFSLKLRSNYIVLSIYIVYCIPLPSNSRDWFE